MTYCGTAVRLNSHHTTLLTGPEPAVMPESIIIQCEQHVIRFGYSDILSVFSGRPPFCRGVTHTAPLLVMYSHCKMVKFKFY